LVWLATNSLRIWWLAHLSTELNGAIFSVSSGKVARVAFVIGEGYFNPDHQPEDLRDNITARLTRGAYMHAPARQTN